MSKTPPKMRKFPANKQRRLDLLLEKNSEGTITAKEKVMLQQLVREAQNLIVENGRRLMDFSKEEAARPSSDAVPVTVWVQPEPAER